MDPVYEKLRLKFIMLVKLQMPLLIYNEALKEFDTIIPFDGDLDKVQRHMSDYLLTSSSLYSIEYDSMFNGQKQILN